MDIFSKILSFFMSVVLFLSGAVRGSTRDKAQNLRVVSYLVINSLSALDTLDCSHFGDLTDVILFGSLAGMNGDGEVELCDDFAAIVARIKELGEGYGLKWHLNFNLLAEHDQKTELRDAFRGKSWQETSAPYWKNTNSTGRSLTTNFRRNGTRSWISASS